MLKQLAGRNQRTKGFKVKNSLQILLFIAGCLWLLYQLKHSYDKNNEYEENSRKTLEKLHLTPKLGRKGFQPWIKKPEDLIDDAEEIIPERLKVRGGGGNDEMNGHDHDKMEEEDSEEVEDLIDEEDKEGIGEIEEEESEEMVKNTEDISSLKDKNHDEGENENGAFRVIMRKMQSTGAESLHTVLANGEDDVPDFSDSEAVSSSSDSLLRMGKAKPGSYHDLPRSIYVELVNVENAVGERQGMRPISL